MTGERDLRKLIGSMQPELNPGEYVFCHLPDKDLMSRDAVIASFYEAEGLSVIVPREYADRRGWPYSCVAAWITLRVHSSLQAVGLTAAVSRALAESGISCNIVAAYHHDHLFVPIADAAAALAALRELMTSGQ